MQIQLPPHPHSFSVVMAQEILSDLLLSTHDFYYPSFYTTVSSSVKKEAEMTGFMFTVINIHTYIHTPGRITFIIIHS